MKNRPKHFYSHLVALDDLEGELSILEISDKEKEDLLDIAHIHLHQTIVDTILSSLKEIDKKRFLELLAEGADEKIWAHLNARVEKIEEKITDSAKYLKRQLKEDVKKLSKN